MLVEGEPVSSMPIMGTATDLIGRYRSSAIVG
jgi:hypothetical protein